MLAIPAHGASLASYRDELGSRAKMEAGARERVGRVRQLLGTKALDFAALADANGPFRKYGAGTDNGAKASASAIFKRLLMDGAEALRNQETREKPPTFDPSNFIAEVDEQIASLRKQFCEEKIASQFPKLVDEYAAYLGRKADYERTARPAASATPRAAALERERRAMVAAYIGVNQPLEANVPSIEKKIGNLETVQFVDGQVVRLLFVKRDKDRKILDVLPVGLSMLTTFRTDKDKYYLVVLDCFDTYVADRIADKRKGPEPKATLELVKTDTDDTLAGGKRAHQLLASLSVKQMDFLIDLLLQTNAADVPTDEEMIPESPATWDPKLQPSVVAAISAFADKNAGDKSKADAVRERLGDYKFYRLMHQQLYELENYLVEEKKLEAQTRSIIRDVKDKK